MHASIILDIDGTVGPFPMSNFSIDKYGLVYSPEAESYYQPEVIETLRKLCEKVEIETGGTGSSGNAEDAECRLKAGNTERDEQGYYADLTIYWGSSRSEESCLSFGAGLGLPSLPFIINSEDRDSEGWNKHHAIKRLLYQHPEEEIVWVDDEIKGAIKDGLIDDEIINSSRVLMISPSVEEGLTMKHLQDMHDFVLSHAPISK